MVILSVLQYKKGSLILNNILKNSKTIWNWNEKIIVIIHVQIPYF